MDPGRRPCLAGKDTAAGGLLDLFIPAVLDYAIVTLDPDGHVLSWNAGAERIKGYRADEVIGRTFEVFYTPEDVQGGRPRQHLAEAAACGRLQYEGWRVRADGSRFWAHIVLTAIYDDEHQLRGFGKIVRDATESRKFQKELMRRALHDPLTDLPNRALLLDRLSKALARLQRNPGNVAVFFVDLDRFKAINDTRGHQVGDKVLIAVAERLRSAVRTQDTVGRLSGDEFVILCDGLHEEPTVTVIAERLAGVLIQPLLVCQEEIPIWASVGIAVTASADDDPEALLRNADAAMYKAKRAAHPERVRFEVFDHE